MINKLHVHIKAEYHVLMSKAFKHIIRYLFIQNLTGTDILWVLPEQRATYVNETSRTHFTRI